MNKAPSPLNITSTGISVCVSKAARYVGAMIYRVIEKDGRDLHVLGRG